MTELALGIALWLWGRLRDFEAKQIATADAGFLYSEMTEAMQTDVLRIAGPLRAFLAAIEDQA